MGHHFEPKYSYVRKSAAIHYQLITTLDDTYDNYATVEEADLFTQALERYAPSSSFKHHPNILIEHYTYDMFFSIENDSF